MPAQSDRARKPLPARTEYRERSISDSDREGSVLAGSEDFALCERKLGLASKIFNSPFALPSRPAGKLSASY